jgi:cyclophilin family peptidyl-prolyl cis-trans isomerase
VLHVKHPLVLPFIFLFSVSCQPAPTPPRNTDPPPQPTLVRTQDAQALIPHTLLDAVSTPDVHEPLVPDWSEAYSSVPLHDARIVSLQLAAQSEVGEAGDLAAFVLGRRCPTERISALLATLPPQLVPVFARGAAGRLPTQQPGSLPASLASFFSGPHPDLAVSTWVYRSRKTIPGPVPTVLQAMTVSSRPEDQLAAARLFAAPNVTPPFELVEYMSPIPMAVAFHAIALRNPTIPLSWKRWLETVAIRTRANLRAWSPAWISLLAEAPRTDPDVRSAILAALAVVRDATAHDPSVDSAFRCANAVTADALGGTPNVVLHCADESFAWRSLVAQVRFVKETPANAERVAILQRVIAQAAGDARVLEAIPEAAMTLAPGLARPILQTLARNRDPGVLAALLEALTLHVQHARSLPSSLREQLLRAPFELEEGPSLEARQQAIALARALGSRVPETTSTVRAMQQANNPDASVEPAHTPNIRNHTLGRLVITTHTGRIVIELDENSAPEAARLVAQTAHEGRYNGTSFHRVVPGFVAQGGDPRGDGYGGTSTVITTELSGQPFSRGAVGIPLAGLDTGGMQFFIVTADAPHLDAHYPYLGHVVEGMEVVDELMIGDGIERVEFLAR